MNAVAIDTGNSPPTLTTVALAGASLPMAMLTLPLVVNVPEFFGNAIGLDLALVGVIFMAIRVLDIVVDPVLGALMDRTTTRWGRYRPWLMLGVPVFAGGTIMLFMPPAGVGAAYLAIGLALAYAGWSILSLAQLAIASGATSSGGRSTVFAWMQAAFLAGLCGVMLLPLLMRGAANDAAATLGATGWLIIAVLVPTIAFLVAVVPERETGARAPSLDIAGYLRLVARPAVARLITADLLFGIGFGVASSVLVFFFIAAKGFERPVLGLLLIAQMGAGVVTMPLMARVAAQFGKAPTLVACGLGATLVCPLMLLVPDGHLPAAIVVMALWGVCYGGVTFLPRAMMADAADTLRAEDGSDRTGMLFALLISSWKLGGALSVGIGFVALDAIGYLPRAGAANAPEALIGLQLLFAVAPALTGLLGAVLCWRYPSSDGSRRAPGGGILVAAE